jgi:hypothetical protein
VGSRALINLIKKLKTRKKPNPDSSWPAPPRPPYRDTGTSVIDRPPR